MIASKKRQNASRWIRKRLTLDQEVAFGYSVARPVIVYAVAAGLFVLGVAVGVVVPTDARAAGERLQLEEPGEVERAPVEESPKPDAADPLTKPEKPMGNPILGSSSDESKAKSDDDAHPDEAVAILPDSEAVDESIDAPDAEEVSEETDAAPAAKKEPESAPRWSIRWQNAFIVERVDDPQFQFLFGGRVQNDWGVYAPDNDLESDFGNEGTGVEFRRARIYFQGQFFRYGFFKAAYDFSDGNDGTQFADVYAGLNIPKIGLIRVGRFKEPFSLEFQDNSNFLSFNERSSSLTFTPGRNTGVMLNGNFLIRDSTFALAFMRRTDDVGEGFSSKEDYHLTTRWTHLPYFEEGGRHLLHVEIGYSHQFADKSQGTQYTQGAANNFAPNLVDTGLLAVSDVDLFNIGLALVEGSFSIQSEATLSIPRGGISEDPVFWGSYVQMSWWVTGENRSYLRGRGVFSRVVPHHRFDPDKGQWGALELATRYSWLDLSDDGIRGGTIHEWSAAINWVLFSNLRMSNNYVLTQTGDRNGFQSGIAHSWVTRFQVDF